MQDETMRYHVKRYDVVDMTFYHMISDYLVIFIMRKQSVVMEQKQEMLRN